MNPFRATRAALGAMAVLGIGAAVPAGADEDGAGSTTRPPSSVTRAMRLVTPAFAPDGVAGGDCPLEFTVVATADPPEGDTPAGIGFTPDGTKIVIAHRDSQNVVVFDAETRAVLRTIPVSGSPTAMAVAPDGVHVVTANIFEDTASIVDIVQGVELFVVPVGDQPGTVAISPDGAIAVVGNTLDEDLSVIDIASGTETKQLGPAGFWLTQSFGSWALTYKFTQIEITPDGSTLIVPALFDDEILLFDITTEVRTALPAHPGPGRFDISADGTTAVFAHHFPEAHVTVIDVGAAAIVDEFPLSASATSIPDVAITPDAAKAVVGVQNAVVVLDLDTGAQSGALSTGSPQDLHTTFDGQYCAVGNYQGSVVSFASESIVGNYLSTTTPDYLAVSPTSHRAATAHALRNEFMEVFNANGASGFFEEKVLTGPPEEGDKARGVALTPDAATAVVISNHSQNATFIDVASQTVTGYANAGVRPGDVAVTPDGARAVIANLDSTFATIVDLDTLATTDVGISRRGSMVRISPDGVHAYIPVVADGDGVWRINLETDTVDGPKILTGNMGGIGFVFDQASGMALSHDGATLVTCGSFTNDVSIIDTALWQEVARITVGAFPVRATFSPDDATIYVSNSNDDTIYVIENAGPASGVVDVMVAGDRPWNMTTNPAGTTLYVANFDDRTIGVYDIPANTLDATIPLPQPNNAGQPIALHVTPDGSTLYVTANGADFHVIDTATNMIADTINTGLAPADMVFSDTLGKALIATPFGADGLVVVDTDACACPADTDGNGQVDVADLVNVITSWGDTGGPADVNGDGTVDVADLVEVITSWGPC